MLPSVASYVQWLVAHRQNRLETLILWADKWKEFAVSSLRQQRLKKLVEIAHTYGINYGIDIPISEIQQHSWRLVTSIDASLEQQTKEIQETIDWLMVAQFDYFSSENGITEFTHANCTLDLQWMNIATLYALEKYNRPFYIKCHCSAGQTCPDYKGGNFLSFIFDCLFKFLFYIRSSYWKTNQL